MIVSLFKTVTNPHDIANPAHIDVVKVLNGIKNGHWKQIVESVRAETVKEKRDAIKRNLPAVLFGGKFSTRRIDGFVESSNLVGIDFDGLDISEMGNMREKLVSLPYVLSVFISPSGRGLKAVIRAKFNSYEEYKSVFCAIDDRLGQLKYFDMQNSDISRACFVSYDPLTYINPDAVSFEGRIDNWEHYLKMRRLATPEKTFEALLKWMNNNGYQYEKGNRNQYLYVLSAAMCRYGIEINIAEGLYIPKFTDLDVREIQSVLASAYKRNEFGIVKMTEVQPETDSDYYKGLEVPDFNFDPELVLDDIEETNSQIEQLAKGVKQFDSFGIDALDKYFVLKRNELYGFVAGSKTGKTLVIKYLAAMAAKYAGWRFLVLTTENEIFEYKSTMIGFLCDKHISHTTPLERSEALEFIDSHFTFLKNDLDHLQILDTYHYQKTKGISYDCIIIDPITNVKKSKRLSAKNGNEYYDELYVEYLKFCKKYATIWVVSHTVTSKERERTAPYVQDAEYGVYLARRCHYGITFYRDSQDAVNQNKVECHIRYVRTALTKGGGVTLSDHPIEMILDIGAGGFHYDFVIDGVTYRNPLRHQKLIILPESKSNNHYEPKDLGFESPRGADF